MPRLFVAIDLPESHRSRLADLRDEALKARWTPAEQMHLTLQFLGEVEAERASGVEGLLAPVREAAFTLQGRGLGVFPSLRQPRILYAEIDPTPALAALQKRIESVLQTSGFEPDPRPYHPHVTCARLKQADRASVQAYLDAHASLVLPPFEALHFHLYESILRPEGALHRRRASFALGPPDG